jgi:HAD superfamily hydrolase (TIGR01509 family)
VIKGVIFDMGGVLAHDVWEGLYREIARRYRLPADRLLRIGERLWAKYDRRAGNAGQLEREYWSSFRRRVRGLPAALTVERLMAMSDRYIRPVDERGMGRVLARLKGKGMALAICSNNNEFWFPRQFYWLGLDRFFAREKVVLSCHEGTVKAAGSFGMFRAAARRLALRPGQCLLIDDRAPYIEGAARCGMPATLFSGFAALERELRRRGL